MAVADRVVVLRLGRNNGVYNVVDVTSETLIAAITGAVDGSITRPSVDVAPTDSPGGKIIRMPSGPRRKKTTGGEK
jgi:hypothetical protein